MYVLYIAKSQIQSFTYNEQAFCHCTTHQVIIKNA